MADVTDLRPGDPEQIAGYRIVSRLGAGGQGVVYLATAPSGGRVAIKQLRFGPDDDRARQQFAKEVAAARLVAPFCTAQVLDADLDGPSPYVVSEYIDGPSLQQRIERRGPMTGADLQRLAIGTATALAAIHQVGVVHRDFKPANVMLAYDGPRVIDFGIARDLSTDTTVTSRVFGTPAYMAPEQLRGERIGPATDMFAWASVIAYAATGRAPFEAPHMVAVMHRISSGEPELTGVPPEMATVLRLCLDKDPAHRPTAQQTLALLLGRPAPEHDVSDPTRVLAEATGLVHAAAAASTTRGAPAPPTVRPPERDATGQPWWVSGLPGPAPASPGANYGTPPGSSPASGYGTPASPASGYRRPSGAAFADGTPSGSGAPPAYSAPPAYGTPAGSDRPSGSRRLQLLGVAAVVLMVVLGGAWAIGQIGDNQTPTSNSETPRGAQSGGPVTSPDTDTQPPKTDTQPPPTEATSAPSTGETDDGDNDDGEDGDENEAGTVPEAFDGTWKGIGFQPSGRVKSWTVEIKLREGKTTGRMKLPEIGCSGNLTVTSASGNELQLVAQMDDNPKRACADRGLVQLTRMGSSALRFHWEDAADSTNQANGILSKT
ncbi:MAG TPA: protein kinase [Kineosporiaceae bacterium]|nr:protein kinase [Kineosporiaceae bacterium]